MELEGDGDLRMFLKGNDKHGHLYMGHSDGLKRRAQKATWSCDHGVVCRRSGRNRDDMVQEGHKGAASDREVRPRSLEMVQTSFETMVYAWVCAPIGLSAVTPPPPLSSMFTEKKTNVHHEKPCSTTDKPMGNCQTATLAICIVLIAGNLPCLPIRRLIFTMVNHAPQPVNPWITGRLQPWVFVIAGRSPHSFIDERRYFNCGKPFSATSKAIGS
ncbi:hypothetical protein Cgig2_015918 [Carnegiea gigantea]|uniref:Uncharacterized protein n=1 Tax=Carnegiea gigantea TaxID=171969 RepID=A0A9Q1KP37_9CARY|nr:hypothetical protein Cgig2_015918 [Carnegiea gigantea]